MIAFNTGHANSPEATVYSGAWPPMLKTDDQFLVWINRQRPPAYLPPNLGNESPAGA